MKNLRKITLGILAFFFVFAANAQNEGREQGQQEYQDENQAMQEETTQEMESDRSVQTRFYEYHDEQTFKGDGLEEAILTAGRERNWDTSGDGKFDAIEFYVVLYHIWDRNHDGKLDQDEWDYGTGNFISEYNQDEFGDFREWDEDRNNEIGINEFARSIEKAGFYNSASSKVDEFQEREQQRGMETDVDQETADTRTEDATEQAGQTEQYRQQDMQNAADYEGVADENMTAQNREMVQQEGEYQEPAPAIVIWERRGVVEQIVIGDRSIDLVENVGRRTDRQ